jgi:hypothetical protein
MSRPENRRSLNLFVKNGPNINIKQPKKSHFTSEEKDYFFNKIKRKQKTEVWLKFKI